MGDVVPFLRPSEPRQADYGTIRIWKQGPEHFEIGHESQNGDSRGNFADFTSASAAIAGAVRLNHAAYDGRANVLIPGGIRQMAEDDQRGRYRRPTLDEILDPAFDLWGGAA